MTAKTKAQRKAEERQRKVTQGLKRMELWTLPEHEAKIREYASSLERERRIGEVVG